MFTTAPIKVKSIRKIEHDEMYVYDITMDNNPHTFFANDILVHNSCYFAIPGVTDLDEAVKVAVECQKMVDYTAIPNLVTNVFNGFDGVMLSAMETINSSTLSFGKKKQYAFLNVWKDGNTLSKKKLKITGLSIKRTDSPASLSEAMTPLFVDLMQGLEQSEIKGRLETIEDDYNALGVYDSGAKRTANNLDKYYRAMIYDAKNGVRPYDITKLLDEIEKQFPKMKVKIPDDIFDQILAIGKGTFSIEDGELIKDKNGSIKMDIKTKMVVPFHIKSAVLFNTLLDENGLGKTFSKIMDGDKIKVLYVKPFKRIIKLTYNGEEFDYYAEFDCIAFPSSTHKIPDFVANDFVMDKKRMIDTYLHKKMENIFSVLDINHNKDFDSEGAESLF